MKHHELHEVWSWWSWMMRTEWAVWLGDKSSGPSCSAEGHCQAHWREHFKVGDTVSVAGYPERLFQVTHADTELWVKPVPLLTAAVKTLLELPIR